VPGSCSASEDPGARSLLVERGLAGAAFAALVADALGGLPFEAMAPTKALLKRYFSPAPWGPDDDRALAELVGAGAGQWATPVDDELTLVYGWDGGSFGVRVDVAAVRPRVGDDILQDTSWLAATFDGPVVPEATPSLRTIRFATGPIHGGPSRWYPSGDEAAEVRVARLFAFSEVANVLVGPDFVSVGLHRPDDWEHLLRPVLDVLTESFTSPDGAAAPAEGAGPSQWLQGGRSAAAQTGHFDKAWAELDGAPTEAIVEAAGADDVIRRQVAARLLVDADAGAAARAWAGLVADPSRLVRRASVDAMVDAAREELRPLLETALADSDPWVRWKALRGLVDLGAGPSREAVSAHTVDPDFRVRLEATAALRRAS
jgi:hypothetical protein